jgi:hypothetical protein
MPDRQLKPLRSIVSYPERGAGGDNRYRGNCSPDLIKDLISHFGVREICDYMCGSNTTSDAADSLGVASKTYDLHSGFDLCNHDIKERPEYIFWHPPYHDIITYSDVMYSAEKVKSQYGYDPRATDLSRIVKWEDFVRTLNACMMKQFCALEKGGRMAVLVGDIKKRGKLYSMIFELIKPGTIENVVIKAQHNCFSDSTQYSGRFIPIVHEYLLLLRKDAPLIYPLLLSYRRDGDIRDMPGATWKDIVADAMESFHSETRLEQIYAAVEPHKRAQTQRHWKEKIRQTLQYYPELFISTRRGVWSLQKYA